MRNSRALQIHFCIKVNKPALLELYWANLLWQKSEGSLWATVKYLQTAVSETSVGCKFACLDVTMFISVSSFAYSDSYFSIL